MPTPKKKNTVKKVASKKSTKKGCQKSQKCCDESNVKVEDVLQRVANLTEADEELILTHGQNSAILVEQFYHHAIRYFLAYFSLQNRPVFVQLVKDWHTLANGIVDSLSDTEGLEAQIIEYLEGKGVKVDTESENYKDIYQKIQKEKIDGTKNTIDDMAVIYTGIILDKTVGEAMEDLPKKEKAPVERDGDGYEDEDGNFVKV